MKVCTDSCLFGAWTAARIHKWMPDTGNILDIGTGTGLLSLMLAQQTKASIYAVELNPAAAAQAEANFAQSPWKDRLKVIHSSINDYVSSKRYDLIISNPPFYEDDLRSPDNNRNAAMHDTTLTLPDLISSVNTYLADDGSASILIPFHRTGELETAAFRSGMHVTERLYIRQTPSHNYFRTIMFLSKYQSSGEKESEMTIHDANRNYTPEFVELLREYYLKL
jgi:tRNA1Val (adenine37-N6)-methyltransferase